MSKPISLDKKESEFLVDAIATMASYSPKYKEMADRLTKRITRANTRIAVSSAKAKGRDLQKWVATQISETIGIPYDQADDNSLIRSREMGQHGTDIILRGEAGNLFPFDIECKNQESISLGSYIEQARANTKEGKDWLVVIKNKNINPPIAVIDFKTILALISSKNSYNKTR